jgi:hypothetical protein
LNCDLPVSTSQVVRITGMTPPSTFPLVKLEITGILLQQWKADKCKQQWKADKCKNDLIHFDFALYLLLILS